MCSKTPSTPQKQPPARTAVCVSADSAGAGRAAPAKRSCGVKTTYANVRMSGSSWNEAERHRVHAVAQAGGSRAVVENMAEMRGATCAADFLPARAGGLALALDQVMARDGLPEARPAGAGVVLGLGVVQRGIAADAAIEPRPRLPVVRPRKRPFGARLARHRIRRRRQLAAPFAVGLDHRFDGREALAHAGGREVLDRDRAGQDAPGWHDP